MKLINTLLVPVVLIALMAWGLSYTIRKEQPLKREETTVAEENVSVDNQRLPSEEEQEERERAAFLPDYTSAPLLSTTDIKCLSMEVGATAGEIRLNWFSPSEEIGRASCRERV